MANSNQIVVEPVLKNCGLLLEAPHWHAATQNLYFVDILSNLVHRYTPADGSHNKVNVGESAGSVVTATSGKLVIASKCRFAYLDWSTGALTTIAKVDEDKPDNTFNDGKCDAKGRFWAGTIGPEIEPLQIPRYQGSLYCLRADKTATKHAEDLDVSNGMGWSPDDKTMYFIDTLSTLIEAFDYNLETGEISNRRAVIKVPEEEGCPDGMCVDMEGMLWVACFTGSRINRYNPTTGEKLQTIMFPTSNITSCCFGGPNLDELYVTSATFGISDEIVKTEQPLAGSLFKVTGLGVKGFDSAEYADYN